MKKIKNNFSKHPYMYSVVLILVIFIIGFYAFGKNGDYSETLVITKSTLKRQISVSGKVVASENAELGFEQGGRISSILAPVGTQVKKGDSIATIENAEIHAEILQKQAAIERENAKLASLRVGTRPEQLQIDKQAQIDSSNSLITTIRSVHSEIENTFINDIDVLFLNGNSVNPDIIINLDSENQSLAIEKDRLVITEELIAWKKTIKSLESSVSHDNINSLLTETKNTLIIVKAFVDKLGLISNNLKNNNTSLTQTQLDAYRNSINTASQSVTDSIKEVQSAEATWLSNTNKLALSVAGSTENDLASQSATLKIAQADLQLTQARLSKTMIKAPFDGVITRMDIKVGEIISPNTSKVSLMSFLNYEIDSYIPEVLIANIKSGNPALVTLDAYGSEVVFDATVTFIDPAETIRDGVSTYKTKMVFNKPDDRIRSGMTANAVITTLEKPDTIVIPQSIIKHSDNTKTVDRLINGVSTETIIETGDSTSLGQVEVINGLSEGDVVIINNLQK
jgi:RND family efflux transporter MFP subunit